MSTAPIRRRQAPPLELARIPDGTSWTARENLADILTRELVGPAEGDTEAIDVAPDTRYLLGRIAPTRLSGDEPPSTQGEDEADSTLDLGDDLAARESRGVPLTDVDDSSIDADEDAITADHDEPIRRGLMIPASMGLRFQVPRDLPAVTVRASWGVYNPQQTGEFTATGRAIRQFVRTPVDVPTTIRLTDLAPGQTASYPLIDDVVLRVDVFDDVERDRRLVEIALCNDRVTPTQIPVNAWMFQTQLHVDADATHGDGEGVFLPVNDVLTDTRDEPDDELRRLRLQYRNRLEFAIGRTCSADWHVPDGARRATRVWTTWLPTVETPQTRAGDVAGAVLDMRRLAQLSPGDLYDALRPIVDGYASWLGLPDAAAPPDGGASQREITEGLPPHLVGEARDAIEEATLVHRQLRAGLDFLVSDPEAQRCFAFMNRVMAEQRVHSQIAEVRKNDVTLSAQAAAAKVAERGPGSHSWRMFQIAFILMQIPAMCRPDEPRRSGPAANVELLFFPTGGGKTEAYLGLAAFTFAIRRRQGLLASPDGDLDGGDGVAVLMRYTLRLLTAQQFQRATTLVCAAELERQADPATWGQTPFRIGLWVGSAVTPKRVKEAAEQLEKVNDQRTQRLPVLQIRRCPWCGTPIDPSSVRVDAAEGRVRVFCGDQLAMCPFAEGGQIEDGLPVLTVDEEIYRLTPAFVVATVDKFARLAREGQAAALFGYVAARCERHGYVHPDDTGCGLDIGAKHPRRADGGRDLQGLPAAAVHPTARLRPPDLIIQDELHLITGALGTSVGLFEVAIDALTTWRTSEGRVAKPLIVASTATVRNAPEQVRGLYGRGVTVFPPQVTDVADTFFSAEVPISEKAPGRRYIGVSTTGVRMTAAEIRLGEVLMAGAQLLLDSSGMAADPYCTLVGYFNATRELAGMSRFMKDDIQTALSRGRPWSGLPRRSGTAYGSLNFDELTSRVSGTEITTTLDQMAIEFDVDHDTTDARRARGEAAEHGKRLPGRKTNPYDVILATSMLQVGVDVPRLGLMLLVGQPKNTAEYIQASSRVGRDAAKPGLVVTLGNWARPRDLAHYEQFRHYHETFYAQVEPLSVTPFSVTSLERGLDGVLVSAARVLQARVPDGLSPEKSAGRIAEQREFAEQLVESLVARCLDASDEPSAHAARLRLLNRLDQWDKRRTTLIRSNLNLAYERIGNQSTYAPLLRSAENVRSRDAGLDDAPFVVANSMREVQPEINLLVSPIPERLFYVEPMTAPDWVSPNDGSDS